MVRGVFELLSGAARTFYGEFTKAGSEGESFYKPVPGLSARGVVLAKGDAQPEARESFYKPVPGLSGRAIVLPDDAGRKGEAFSVLDAPDLNKLRDRIRAGEAGVPRVIREAPDFGKAKSGTESSAGVVPDLHKLREMVMAGQAGGPRSTDHLFVAKPGIDYGRGKKDAGREDRGPQWIEPDWEP